MHPPRPSRPSVCGGPWLDLGQQRCQLCETLRGTLDWNPTTRQAVLTRILTSYYRPKPGGCCTRLFRAINALAEHGHDVHYLAVVPFPVDHPRCHFHRFPWPAAHTRGLLFWTVFYALAPILLTYLGIRHRVTHAFAFTAAYGLLLQPLRLIRGIPLSVFLRADSIENYRLSGYPRWMVSLEKLLEGVAIAGVRLYGVTATLTRRVSQRHRLLRPGLIATLPNDIPASAPIAPPAPAGQPLRLAAVGILEARKNQRFLLECMAKIPPTTAKLYLYGCGPDEQQLHALAAKLGLDDHVRFMGWVEDQETIWQQTDLLLFPSRSEGAPNAVLEAIARGIPVLASDIPEHREILPAESLLPIDDLNSWRAAIARADGDPRAVLTELARLQDRYAETLRFDWDARVRQLILTEKREP
jgi:glycosyltransferase involved in cell wall biosynthesis